MRGLNEKYILKRAVADLLPTEVLDRSKQPYRAPDAVSFFPGPDGPPPPDYVAICWIADRVEQYGLFRARAVDKLVEKARQRQTSAAPATTWRLVAILSTQILIHQFLDQPGKMEPHERVYAAG